VFNAAENSIGVMGFSITIAGNVLQGVCVLLSDVCFWCMNVVVKFLLNKSAISSLWVVF